MSDFMIFLIYGFVFLCASLATWNACKPCHLTDEDARKVLRELGMEEEDKPV